MTIMIRFSEQDFEPVQYQVRDRVVNRVGPGAKPN